MNAIRLFSFTAALLVAFLATGPLAAAEPVRVEVLSIEEQAGRLSVTLVVHGPDGLPVSNLGAGSLRATLNGTQLPVAGVQGTTSARPPLSVLLMVDVSGSMYGEPLAGAKRAMTEFIASLEPADPVALYTFGTTVRLIQDFTTDKAMATQAVNSISALGDTALYDAVTEAVNKAGTAATDRKMVVLLSDGVANINPEGRAASLSAARQAGINVVAIGLGKVDRPYLGELAAATGGSFLDAPTPAALRQAYANLAAAIRTQYTVSLTVPDVIDRTVPGKLSIRAAIGADSGVVERDLGPLAGALPPPFELAVSGLLSGARVDETTAVEPALPANLSTPAVEYFIDDQPVHKATSAPYGYQIDPALLAEGNHVLKVVATDARGARGQKQVTFRSVVPVVKVESSGGGGVPMAVLYLIAAVAAGIGVVVFILKRRQPATDTFATRIKPWQGRLPDVTSPMAEPPGEWQPRELPKPPPPANRPLGRLILIDEDSIRSGDLGGIREIEIGSNPLTLGTTSGCDIIIDDPEGRVAGEEARLWIQRGRLVYHKLTTLSAMATEGVTSGWQFLDSGEDMRIARFRLTFQLESPYEPEPEPQPEPEAVTTPRLRDLFGSEAEPLGASSD